MKMPLQDTHANTALWLRAQGAHNRERATHTARLEAELSVAHDEAARAKERATQAGRASEARQAYIRTQADALRQAVHKLR